LHRRLPNLVVAHELAELLKLGGVDEAHAPGDFFGEEMSMPWRSCSAWT
jgi:hypothetical protein